MIDPSEQQTFALEVVRRLRTAGFEAYWAGGCVRDELLGRTPKDFDVATSAQPSQIRAVFGFKRTRAIGAAFGVITVLGSRRAGMIEVATFRQDAAYSDGRHPDFVTFGSAAEDAQRRDFTINGLFYDPVERRVIDFVGGQEDLARRMIRAIGAPRLRFAEDKLRMLRAVRFTATFGFALDPATADAVREMAGEITVVSPERIAMEMRRVLVEPGRARGVRLLVDLHLAEKVLPEIVACDATTAATFDHALDVLARLRKPRFPLALAAVLLGSFGADAAREIGQRWRLSNKEVERTAWLVANRTALAGAPTARWSRVQPLLVHEGIADLLALHEADTPQGPTEAAWCRSRLELPREVLDLPPLVTGDDLTAHGLRPGPAFRTLLQRLRDAQLDGEIHTKAAAIALAEQWLR